MPPQGGFVSEGPSAGIAHEGLLPSVYAMVPLQRIQLRELLPTLVTAIGPLTWKHSTRCVTPWVTSVSPCASSQKRDDIPQEENVSTARLASVAPTMVTQTLDTRCRKKGERKA